MYNLAEYRDGLAFNSLMINPDQMYTFGDGYSTGVEFFLKKSKGRFTGFVGYTLAYTKRRFPELNGGEPFYAKSHTIIFDETYFKPRCNRQRLAQHKMGSYV